MTQFFSFENLGGQRAFETFKKKLNPSWAGPVLSCTVGPHGLRVLERRKQSHALTKQASSLPRKKTDLKKRERSQSEYRAGQP
jgi:hypothetical protein